MPKDQQAAIETDGWLRGPKYREKYDIGNTTFWKWRKQGRIETHEIDGIVYVRDRLPSSTPIES